MPLIEPDITIPVGSRYEGEWAKPFTGTYDVWLPIRDLSGLTDAATAVFRAKGRTFQGMSQELLDQRRAMLDVAEKVILAERELQLREFAKRLPGALETK